MKDLLDNIEIQFNKYSIKNKMKSKFFKSFLELCSLKSSKLMPEEINITERVMIQMS